MLKISREKILVILAERGMTIRELSELVGLFPNNVSTILSRGTCSPITAGKIASALNVAVSDIVES